MSFLIEAIKGLTPEQQEAVLKLDPVLRAHGTSGVVEHVGSLANLTAIDGLKPKQVTDLLVAFAGDLFAVQYDISAYGHLLAADERDRGRRAIERAINHGRLELLRKHFRISSTPEDRQCAFEAALASGRLNDAFAYVHIPTIHFKRAPSRAEKDSWRRLLGAAVGQGDLNTANACLRYLGRDFTRAEAGALARQILEHHTGGGGLNSEELKIVVRHALLRDRKAYLLQWVHHAINWTKIEKLAQKLRVRLCQKDLLAIIRNPNVRADIKAIFADRLLILADTPKHLEIRRRAFLAAREWALNNSEIVRADDFGTLVDLPLTPDELLAFIRRWKNSTVPNAHHYNPLIPWAQELMLKRLQDPSAPTPALPNARRAA